MPDRHPAVHVVPAPVLDVPRVARRHAPGPRVGAVGPSSASDRNSSGMWSRPSEFASSSSANMCRALGRTPLSLPRLTVSGWVLRRRFSSAHDSSLKPHEPLREVVGEDVDYSAMLDALSRHLAGPSTRTRQDALAVCPLLELGESVFRAGPPPRPDFPCMLPFGVARRLRAALASSQFQPDVRADGPATGQSARVRLTSTSSPVRHFRYFSRLLTFYRYAGPASR